MSLPSFAELLSLVGGQQPAHRATLSTTGPKSIDLPIAFSFLFPDLAASYHTLCSLAPSSDPHRPPCDSPRGKPSLEYNNTPIPGLRVTKLVIESLLYGKPDRQEELRVALNPLAALLGRWKNCNERFVWKQDRYNNWGFFRMTDGDSILPPLDIDGQSSGSSSVGAPGAEVTKVALEALFAYNQYQQDVRRAAMEPLEVLLAKWQLENTKDVWKNHDGEFPSDSEEETETMQGGVNQPGSLENLDPLASLPGPAISLDATSDSEELELMYPLSSEAHTPIAQLPGIMELHGLDLSQMQLTDDLGTEIEINICSRPAENHSFALLATADGDNRFSNNTHFLLDKFLEDGAYHLSPDGRLTPVSGDHVILGHTSEELNHLEAGLFQREEGTREAIEQKNIEEQEALAKHRRAEYLLRHLDRTNPFDWIHGNVIPQKLKNVILPTPFSLNVRYPLDFDMPPLMFLIWKILRKGHGYSNLEIVRSVPTQLNGVGFRKNSFWALKTYRSLYDTEETHRIGVNQLKAEIRAYRRIAESPKNNKPGFLFLLTLEAVMTCRDEYSLVLPLMPMDLRHRMTKERLHPADARRMMAQISIAVATLHSIGIIHADLKPENVLIDPRGNVKLADFGMSYVSSDLGPLHPRRVYSEDLVGTRGYIAPEAYAEKFGLEVDYFSLGCIFFEMVTGADVLFGDIEVYQNWVNFSSKTPAGREKFFAAFRLSTYVYLLICGLLEPELKHRFGIADILNSLYFEDEGSCSEFIDMENALGREYVNFNVGPQMTPRCRIVGKPSDGSFFRWLNPYGTFFPR